MSYYKNVPYKERNWLSNMYAPVIIPTLNRHEHLIRCINSLKRNPLAKETELYISLDYPPAEKYVDGYLKIKKYLEKELISGFKKIYIFYQDKNLGPINNIFFLRQEVFKKYDNYIFTEDDNEFSANFLEYMNKGLELFESDEQILAICGYRNDKPWKCDDGNVMKLSIFHAWGYATWKEKIDKCHEWICRDNFIKLLNDKKFCDDLYATRYKSYYTFIEALLANPTDYRNVYINSQGDIEEIDYTIGIYMIVSGMYAVLPSVTKVRNWGYDGTGVNCGRDDKIDPKQILLDEADSFEFIVPKVFEIDEENQELSKDEAYKENAKRAKRFKILMCMVGVPFARKVNNFLYRLQKFGRHIYKE